MQDLRRFLGGLLAAVLGAALLLIALPTRAHADEFNKATYFTFDAPVGLPGITLPAGTYLFKLADPNDGRSVIDVCDQTDQTCYGVFDTIPVQESHSSDHPSIKFMERATNAPEAVAAWFYPGERTGWQFVYTPRHNG